MSTCRSASSRFAEAGEHFVLHKLYLLDLVGGQAPRGMAETDLLVMRRDGSDVATVQVKARRERPADRRVDARKHEDIIRDNLWYVFVCFGGDHPLCYVIPSAVVAHAVAKRHKAWLERPGRSGQQHRDSAFRRLCPTDSAKLDVPGYPDGWMDKYMEDWHPLGA
jgi:hypothetical protein